MSKVTLSPSSSTNTGAPRFPDSNYKMRIKEEPKFEVSKKGNEMYVFLFESVEPATGIVDGQQVTFAGWEFKTWATFFENKDGNVVNPSLEAIHKQCELPMDFDKDESTGLPAGIQYTGREVWVRARTESEPLIDPNTGKPLVNPLTGKPQSSHNRRIVSIITA